MKFIEVPTYSIEYESKDSYERIIKPGQSRLINVDAIQQIILHHEQPKNDTVSLVCLANGSFLCLGTPRQVADIIQIAIDKLSHVK